jgi:hypothetical protein
VEAIAKKQWDQAFKYNLLMMEELIIQDLECLTGDILSSIMPGKIRKG